MLEFKLKAPKLTIFNTKKSVGTLDTLGRIYMDRVLLKEQNEIQKLAPTGDTGLLRASISTKLQRSVGFLTGTVFIEATKGVGSYAAVMEFGRRKGKKQPPSKVFFGWLRNTTQGREFFADLKSTYKKITIPQAAFILARSIKKKGIKGKHYFKNGLKEAKPSVKHILKQYKKAIAKKLYAG